MGPPDRLCQRSLRCDHLPWEEESQHPQAYVTSYERMVTDFEGWLDDLLSYCELDISEELRQSIIANNNKRKPTTENVNAHLRKGQPGDHLDKLKPETIEALNSRLGSARQALGYS